jgi:hypothetical protein
VLPNDIGDIGRKWWTGFEEEADIDSSATVLVRVQALLGELNVGGTASLCRCTEPEALLEYEHGMDLTLHR